MSACWWWLLLLGALAACSDRAAGVVAPAESRTPAVEQGAAAARRSPPSGTIEVIALGTGTAFRFKGMVVDAARERIYLGSWDRKELVGIDRRDGSQRLIPTAYSGVLNAMGLFLRDDRLYALMNEIDDDPDAHARSALVVIDTASLAVLRAYELRGEVQRHHFNHVILDGRGVAYVSDTVQGRIYTVDTNDADAHFELLVANEALSWVHGLTFTADGAMLATTSYAGGIRFYDLARRQFAPFADLATAGDDDLLYHQGALYGIGQNRLTRYLLSDAEDAVVGSEILLADHELFNDPRVLYIDDGWLYCLANIELEPVELSDGRGRRQALTDSHVIRYRL